MYDQLEIERLTLQKYKCTEAAQSKKMVKIIRWLEVKIILTWPAWVVMCYFRFEPEENLLLQYGHAKGFSPVWMRMCRILFEI